MKKIASNCLFIKGYNHNLLIDIQNNTWYHIKENEEELISEKLNKSMKEYLEKEAILINIPEQFIKNFPKLDLNYYSFSKIETIIIDIDSNTKFNVINVINVIKKLENANPMLLQLRYFTEVNVKSLIEILDFLKYTTIESLEVILPYSDKTFFLLNDKNIIDKYGKLRRLIIHSVNNQKIEDSVSSKIMFSTEIIENNLNCGQISYFNFSNVSSQILKSMNYNSCLYKKIGIDVEGNIKNCPSLNTKLGNVFDENFELNFENKLFQTESIKKDDIEVCKDCEFRHICMDCRAFTDSKKRPNARPSKCQYNPYISKWSHEDGYYSLQDSGIISNENEFSIDHLKIKKINDQLNNVNSNII